MLFGAKRRRYQAKTFGVLIVLALLWPTLWARGQRKPLTVDEIVVLLANPKIKEEEIVDRIQEYKVEFGLDAVSLAKLERASVTTRILEVIKKNPFSDLFFTFPFDGGRVSRLTTVYGWSRTFPGKHLWLFVHSTGVVDWIPQPDEVSVGANGDWQHVIYVGSVQEPKIVDFEIKAVWIDGPAQSELEEYFKSKCRKESVSYPDDCPSRRIPPGAPVAQTGVLRSH